MVHIYLVRHGESTWNLQRRWQGQADPPLSAEGVAQAEKIAARLADVDFDHVVTSDLARARETAARIARRHGLDLDARPDFRELDVGAWAGHTSEEIAERFPDEWSAYQQGTDPRRGGGETLAELRSRVSSALETLLAEAHDAGWTQVCLVAHGGVVRAGAELALGLGTADPSAPSALAAPRNCAVAEITNSARGIRLLRYNDATHLGTLADTALDA